MNPIVLYGLRASGKTTLGRLLAQSLNYTFIDQDEYIITSSGMTVSEIFEGKGESGFRDMEHAALKKILLSHENLVIALGGGCVFFERNRQLLKQFTTKNIYLSVQLDEQVARLINERQNGDDRPSLTDSGSLRDECESLYKLRTPIYEAFADHIIHNDGDADIALAELMLIMSCDDH